jgi:hypothetical protein
VARTETASVRQIRCGACGADIAVRTFRAGDVRCPQCGAATDLAGDLAQRMRAYQDRLAAESQAQMQVEVGSKAGAPASTWVTLTAVIGGVVLLALGAAAWILAR